VAFSRIVSLWECGRFPQTKNLEVQIQHVTEGNSRALGDSLIKS